MKKRIKLLALVLALTLIAGCAPSAALSATDLMADVEPNGAPDAALTDETRQGAADFSVRLLEACLDEGENVLVSPLSVLSALGLAEMGAGNETLSQMERALGLTRAQLCGELAAWSAALPQSEKARLALANAIWLRDVETLHVRESFLQDNADTFGAQVYRAKFDASTVRDINRWVKSQTDGMIDRVLNEIPDEAMLYLINALSFDAEWRTVYDEYQVRDGVFTAASGAEREVEFLRSSEYTYLSGAGATGVVKPYAGGQYAFAALLPDEGTEIAQVLENLRGDGWLTLLENASSERVITAIPKFKTEFSAELSGALTDMGMEDAFDRYAADFSGVGTCDEGALYLSRVLHKTAICVDERGTKAGAVTVVEMASGATDGPEEPPKQVILDRPFVYAIYDTETGLPLFFGVLRDVG